jgi:hypothetical protein
MEEMPSLRWMSFVERLAHYEGAMRHLAMQYAEDNDDTPSQPATTSVGRDAAEMGDFDAMAVHPVWSQIGSFTRAPLEDQ